MEARITGIIASATASALNIGGGGRMTSSASTEGIVYERLQAVGVVIRGGRGQHVHGIEDAGCSRQADQQAARRVASLSPASFKPTGSRASAAMTPGPPASVRIATRSPRGKGQHSKARAQSNICSVDAGAKDPGPGEGSIKGYVGGSQRSGVRGGCFLAGLANVRL